MSFELIGSSLRFIKIKMTTGGLTGQGMALYFNRSRIAMEAFSLRTMVPFASFDTSWIPCPSSNLSSRALPLNVSRPLPLSSGGILLAKSATSKF